MLNISISQDCQDQAKIIHYLVLSNLYCEILKQIPNANDRVDIMNEINQYFGIIFKHRFIRHIQIKLEELEKIKVE